MKIAVLSANGKAGRLIVKEALARNYSVTSFIRQNKSVNSNNNVIVKDILDLTPEDVRDFDVVISAFGVFTEKELPLYSTVIQHLSNILSNTKTRLLIVGGAGSLYIDPGHKIKLLETKDFPQEYVPLASAMAHALDELKQRNDVQWTFLSPAIFFDPEGPRTGKYILGNEEVIVNSLGKSYISYADYAIAMIDEIEQKKHIQKRFSVIGE